MVEPGVFYALPAAFCFRARRRSSAELRRSCQLHLGFTLLRDSNTVPPFACSGRHSDAFLAHNPTLCKLTRFFVEFDPEDGQGQGATIEGKVKVAALRIDTAADRYSHFFEAIRQGMGAVVKR